MRSNFEAIMIVLKKMKGFNFSLKGEKEVFL